ncbi:hypothetical protein NC651_006944 [Populus alba x Populus x berolinensis]|nr:hypothetical protein NC651_006944 [Populus alba x Populus x berolinensis]
MICDWFTTLVLLGIEICLGEFLSLNAFLPVAVLEQRDWFVGVMDGRFIGRRVDGVYLHYCYDDDGFGWTSSVIYLVEDVLNIGGC